jgi:hypothetical protein
VKFSIDRKFLSDRNIAVDGIPDEAHDMNPELNETRKIENEFRSTPSLPPSIDMSPEDFEQSKRDATFDLYRDSRGATGAVALLVVGFLLTVGLVLPVALFAYLCLTRR